MKHKPPGTQDVALGSVESKRDHSEKPKGERIEVRIPGSGVPAATGRLGAAEWAFEASYCKIGQKPMAWEVIGLE